MNRHFFTLAVAFFLASCSNVERSNPDDPGSNTYHGGYQVVSSTSVGRSSSSAGVVSSSSEPVSSSSSADLYILTCKVVVDTATESQTISDDNKPKITCREKAYPNNEISLEPQFENYKWENNPDWHSPKEGVYDNIKVIVFDDAKACQGKTIICEGSLRICPESGCFVSSSSEAISSSSSVTLSSSSIAPSSSSAKSSSSVVSSSSKASSSSVAQSSSSVSATYTITFNANGGTVSPTSAQTGTNGRLTSLPTPTRTGYTFNGWATTDGTVVTTSTVFTANTTIYAKWTLITYTITFNANGGSVTPTSGTTGEGGKLASLPIPTRTNFTFNGWFTSSSSGIEVTANTVFAENSTIYAQWSRPIVSNCDGITFRTVEIGTQTWMAENLNCNISGSKCYNNQESNCDTYGRLYDWATAMNLPSSCNSSSCASQVGTKHRGICPSGWHIPNDTEWDALMTAVGGSSTAGRKLKATSGWNNCGPSGSGSSYVCEDAYGFSALPGGNSLSGGGFGNVGISGIWWSASQGLWWSGVDDGRSAYYRCMSYNNEQVVNINNYESKNLLVSVRCLQD